MTRRKWTKLRRQRPELFRDLPPFEKWNEFERSLMRSVSKREAITVMTPRAVAAVLSGVDDDSSWRRPASVGIIVDSFL